MSDVNTFINTYIDHALGMLHENINELLRVKTEAKISGDLLKGKDEAIVGLQKELESLKADLQGTREEVVTDKKVIETTIAEAHGQVNEARAAALAWETEAQALKNRVGILDALQTQYNDLRNTHDVLRNEYAAKAEEFQLVRGKLQGEVAGLVVERDNLAKEVKRLAKLVPPEKTVINKEVPKKAPAVSTKKAEEQVNDF